MTDIRDIRNAGKYSSESICGMSFGHTHGGRVMLDWGCETARQLLTFSTPGPFGGGSVPRMSSGKKGIRK